MKIKPSEYSNILNKYNSEKVEGNNKKIVYTITFLKNDATVASGAKYHAVIKKPSNKKEIKVVENVKDHI